MSTQTLAPGRTGFSLEPLAGFESAREEWAELALASGNVFLTPEWLGAWWRTFGEGHELALSLVRRENGSAAAILPLYRDHCPPASLRMIGHTQSDLLGPVCAPEDRGLATRALLALLAEEKAASLFVGNSIPVSEGWAASLGGSTVSSISSPSLAFGGRDWEGVMAERSNHFRKRVRQVNRRLERQHDVVWRLGDAADLERFIELHERRWQGESGAFQGSWGDLHRDFVPIAAERGWLRLHLMELDGELAGALYNLRFVDVDLNYQSARDTTRDKLELGLAMNSRAIQEAIADGMSEYRFLRGAEQYKSRLANLDDPVETVAVPLRLRARVLPPLLRRASQMPNTARRRLLRIVSAMLPASATLGQMAADSGGLVAVAVYL